MVSGRMVFTTVDPQRDRAPPGLGGGEVPVGEAERRSELRVHLDEGLGAVVHERSDAPRLGAGEEVAHHAAGGEDQRVLGVHVFGGGRVGSGHEARLAVGEVERPLAPGHRVHGAGLEQARRSRMVVGRAGPEDAVLPLHLLVGDARVVGDAALRGLAQLGEDRGGAREA